MTRLLFLYLFAAKFVLVYIHTTAFTIAGTRIARTLRLAYVQSILRQDITYFDICSPGTVATRISTNANLIQSGLSEKVGTFFQSIATLVAAMLVALTQSWKLALVTATSIPAAIIATVITVSIDAKLETSILAAYTTAGGLAEESFSSVKIIAAFEAHEKLKAKYESYLDRVMKAGAKKGPVLGIQYAAEYFFMYCAYALSFWYGIKLFLQGEIRDGGTVMTVFFCVIVATTALVIVAPSLNDFTKAAAAATDVLEAINRQPKIDSLSKDGAKPASTPGKLEFKEISFSYPARPTVPVLDNLSLVLEAGKTTAIVGASGSGKSTIVGLIERWYDPLEGGVFLDGTDLRSLNLIWLRTQLGLVQQESVLFNDTIYQNVMHGLHGTEMAELDIEEKRTLIERACKEVNADEFIRRMPNGYNTVVGERADLLSGGQRQRLAIARSIVSNPAILLLDEATSALDPYNESTVQIAIDRCSTSRTVLIIAHKLSTVKRADKIIVMDKGRVVEQGTHEALLTAKAAYYRLVQAQEMDGTGTDTINNLEKTSSSISKSNFDERLPVTQLPANTCNRAMSSSKPATQNPPEQDVSRKYNLLRCLYIVFQEQRNLWPWLTAGLFASVCSGGVFPAQAILFSHIVTLFQISNKDTLQEQGSFWALMFFILALATLLSYAALGFFLTISAFRATRYLRAEYFSAMLRQNIEFYDRPENSSGSLAARLSSDPQNLQELIAANAGVIIVVVSIVFSCCILALVTGWKLALVSIFGCLPPVFAAGFTRMRLDMGSQDATASIFLESARFAAEAVGAIRTVSSLTLEGEVYRRYADRLRGPVKSAYKHTALVMILFALSESVDLLGMALAFWYGGRLVSFDEYSTRQFFIVFVAIVFGGQAAGLIFGFTLNLTKGHSAANKIIHLRRQVRRADVREGDAVTRPTRTAITFQDVHFHFPTRPEVKVLQGLDLVIQSGQNVAIVGASGSGKSTIISLLERFYAPTTGSILLNDRPVSELHIGSYRSIIALVSQETVLYSGSVRENIFFGARRERETDEHLESAAKAAHIHDFITSLPQGYDTDVGTKGIAFSGGQRQRIAIARALIRDPAILLLDEATSALDTESEMTVQKAIDKAAKGRTTITVSHRLHTVQSADRIFVLEAGRVIEAGKHEELMRAKGRYWKMRMNQSFERSYGSGVKLE